MQIVKFEKILLKGESDKAHALRFFNCLAASAPSVKKIWLILKNFIIKKESKKNENT